jgi:RNA polymerase sigma-70 factor (ECF subfamily)
MSEGVQMSTDLGQINQEMFGSLVEPYRRELQLHCYRMMGTLQDAEDMVQETFLKAWRGRRTYAERASLRAWLYKIATHACLDALRKRPRRYIPLTWDEASRLEEPIPASVMEPVWLEPYPDGWLIQSEADPETQLAAREHITLAFIAALHLLPPRQRAVLLFREVLEWSASEVAALLEISVGAVKSMLHRARATLASRTEATFGAMDHSLDETGRNLLERYVQAWEAADVDELIRLLYEDATFSMPPIPAWYQGRETIRELTAKTVFGGEARGRWKLLPARANGQAAFGLYRAEGPGQYSAYGIQVLTARGRLLADIITFRVPGLVGKFGLPEGIRS